MPTEIAFSDHDLFDHDCDIDDVGVPGPYIGTSLEKGKKHLSTNNFHITATFL